MPRSDDEEEHEELAVDARAAQVAAHPAVEAEVDEGREGPDFFRLDEAAEHAGEQADGGVERQRKIFAVVHRGSGKHDAAEHRPARSDEQAEEDDGFEGNVGGEKVGDRDADPDAEGEGNEEEGQQARVCRGRRCSAKNRRRKVLPRASTLATDATTPSLTSSVIRMSLSVTSPLYRAAEVLPKCKPRRFSSLRRVDRRSQPV